MAGGEGIRKTGKTVHHIVHNVPRFPHGVIRHVLAGEAQQGGHGDKRGQHIPGIAFPMP